MMDCKRTLTRTLDAETLDSAEVALHETADLLTVLLMATAERGETLTKTELHAVVTVLHLAENRAHNTQIMLDRAGEITREARHAGR